MEKRGRLSSIERLSKHAKLIVAQLNRRIAERTFTQLEMLDELNAGLKSINLDPISKSSLNRYCLSGKYTFTGDKISEPDLDCNTCPKPFFYGVKIGLGFTVGLLPAIAIVVLIILIEGI